MNRRRTPAFLRVCPALILFLICAGLPQTGTLSRPREDSKTDYLTALEREVINEMNLARTRPLEYAVFLEQTKQYYNGKDLKLPGQKIITETQEGVSAVDDAIQFLRAVTPMPPLELSKGMCLGAKDQSTDQGKTGAVGHEGSDKSFSWERVRRYGEWKTPISENISYGTTTARQIVMDFIVDDGVPQRGHRKNIFNAKYFVMGVSAGNHSVYGSICVVTFAGAFTDSPAGGPTPAAATPADAKPAARKF